jgi:hypothetical protein
VKAFFGKPQSTFVPGGAHVSVYLVPVYEGRLLVYDVAAKQARGRWLPWDVLPFGGNPYETAAELGDDWCSGAVTDLQLVDVMSFPVDREGWEIAIIFRAEVSVVEAAAERTPYLYPAGEFDAIGNFDPVDLERWVTRAAGSAAPADGPATGSAAKPGLLF